MAKLIEIEVGTYNGERAWKCDNCNDVWVFLENGPKENNYNYCPNCGAEIEESEG